MSSDKTIILEGAAVARLDPESVADLAARFGIRPDEVTHIHLQGSLPDEPSKGV